MSRSISLRARALTLLVALSTLLASNAVAGGPVMLSGHDPDDHGFQSAYAALFTQMRANVTNGGNNILAIGANPGSTAGNWITAVAGLMTPPQTVTFVNGSAISSVSFAGYAILHVPSTTVDVSGGIDASTEQPLLVARSMDIAAFINAGGGLFGLTQDSVATAYQYLGPFANVSSLGVASSGSCGGGAQFDNVTSSPQGEALGITNTNIDGCCWHNVFSSYPDFLQPLVTANEPSCTNPVINQLPAVLGCLECNIPGQMSLSPALAFNLPLTQHTVTATFVKGTVPHDPIVGATVSFQVISGPNAGDTGSGVTNGSGQATFTYTGDGGIGVDRIKATATDPNTSTLVTSNEALKFWDNDCDANLVPDTCSISCAGFGGDCINFPACGTTPDTNNNSVPDTCETTCTTNADCDDGAFCNGAETCDSGACSPSPGDPCVNGPQCQDVCNESLDDCIRPNGTSCDDGLFCTAVDVCTNGMCAGSGDPCAGGAECADVCNEAAQSCVSPQGDPCGDATDEECSDPDTCDGAGNCDANDEAQDTPCGDPTAGDCTDADTCDGAGVCAPNDAPAGTVCGDQTTTPCSGADTCDGAGTCQSNDIGEGQPCDDGDPCSTTEVCLSGTCTTCGNGSTDATCGETCDPPVSGTCDPTCQLVVCGNGIVQSGEECDDANTTNGDGCGADCQFEDKLCIEGIQPSVALNVKRVAFASDFDYVGENADGNQEIYYLERKKLDKAIKKAMKKQHLTLSDAKAYVLANTDPHKFFGQLTHTTAPVLNELPSLNGSGRMAAFVTNGDLKPGDPGSTDGNREIFRVDIKRALRGDPTATVQVTNTPVGVDNLNPNLRAFKGNLLAFDSDGDLTPDLCVGGPADGLLCADNPGCKCGNPELNREVFVYVRLADIFGASPIRQLTAAAAGASTVGQSVNFFTRATAFSSTADLIPGGNLDGNREIYRVQGTADSLAQITTTSAGEQSIDPAQGVRGRMAFASTANFTGENGDANREIFFWTDGDPAVFTQIGSSMTCDNGVPSIDARGRYAAFHSTCARIPTLINPDQSIFVWDDKKVRFLPLMIRGELNAASANAQATKSVRIITYESNLGSITDPAICFLNVRAFLKTLERQP